MAFDIWYSGLENLKLIRSFGWVWLTRLKANGKVNLDGEGLRAVSEVEVGVAGRVVGSGNPANREARKPDSLLRLTRVITVTGYKGGIAESATVFDLASYFSNLGRPS